MKPKILYLVTSSGWGGAERYVARLASEASREFDVTVMAGAGKMDLRGRLPQNVAYTTLPGLKSALTPLRDIAVILRLRAIIDREGFDIIHCNSSKAGLVGALAAAASKRKPKVVFTAHGWGFLESRSPLFTRLVLWSEKLASRFRAATIVLSEAERRVALEQKLSSPENLHVIPHGVDPGEIDFLGRDEARRELQRLTGMTEHDDRVVGTIANAYAPKALPLLIDAFTKAGVGDTRLVILGDGPMMDAVRAARDSSPAKERILLPGAVPEAARLLKGFDVFVLSSVKEGMPWVILEASLAGVPIVATKVGALPEMIHAGEGILVAPGDADALGAALRRVLTDAELSAKLKTGAPRVAERRSASGMIERTFSLYRTLLRG